MNFYSHVKKDKNGSIIKCSEILLKKHLQNVAANIKTEIEDTIFGENIYNNYLSEIGYLIGIGHDFGKYTSYFQKKLLEDINSEKANHQLIGALFIFYIVSNYINGKKLSGNVFFKYLPLISFQIVRHHHGNLMNISKDVGIKSNLNILIKQIEDIKGNHNIIQKELNEIANLFSINFNKFYSLFDKIDDEDYQTQIEYDIAKIENQYNISKIEEEIKNYYFIINQYLYSLLISNDKNEASQTRRLNRLSIENNIVDRYKHKKFGITDNYIKRVKSLKINDLENLNEIKEKIYQSVLSEFDKIDIKEKKIFTITAPTGTGKTLAAFATALKIRGKCEFNPRIIYSLPFTSIIDQNYTVIEEVLEFNLKDKFEINKSRYLIKHHHLTDMTYKSDNENKSVEKSLMYIEDWDSEIIVTTFIQLFYTLLGFKNKTLKKFHNIVNSIIILDEVQNIPLKYWKIVNVILKLMKKYFNTYLILLTATKPLIFNEIEAEELLKENGKYFSTPKLNRTKLINTEIDTFDKLVTKLIKEKDKIDSIMIILNTIKSTLIIYDLIKKDDNNFGEFKKIYLSTNLTPIERKYRIEKIKEISDMNNRNEEYKEKIIIITTQLVEAGVDIDVDLIFRDMAPLDSIIQASGRTNRNGNPAKTGKVYLINLKDENNKRKPYSSYIYDDIALREGTENILGKNCQKEEKDYLKLINKFFKKMNKLKSKQSSELLLKSIQDFYYYDRDFDKNKRIPISEFKLIEEIPNYVNVFIEIDEMAKFIWEFYKKFVLDFKETKYMGKYYNNLILRSYFNNYTISVPEKYVMGNSDCEPIFENLYKLSLENVKICSKAEKENKYISYYFESNSDYIIDKDIKNIIFAAASLEINDINKKLNGLFNKYIKSLKFEDLSMTGFNRKEISHSEIL